MIHACPARMWYVENFLVPSMIDQGIRRDEITIWNDSDGKGNLTSCLESFASLKDISGGTWHLQDDVMICHDFAKRTKALAGDHIICGFCFSGYEEGDPPVTGWVFPVLMWNSCFLCVYIPNEIASNFVHWFYSEARARPEFAGWVESNKHDDTLFHEYCIEEQPNTLALNYAPHLVEHVDYLVGGSIINQWRGHTSRGYYFEDDDLTDELTEKVVKYRKSKREATTLKA